MLRLMGMVTGYCTSTRTNVCYKNRSDNHNLCSVVIFTDESFQLLDGDKIAALVCLCLTISLVVCLLMVRRLPGLLQKD